MNVLIIKARQGVVRAFVPLYHSLLRFKTTKDGKVFRMPKQISLIFCNALQMEEKMRSDSFLFLHFLA